MKLLVVLVLLLGSAFCENPHKSLTEVIKAVMADTDTDGDGVISTAEFQTELLTRWDIDGDERVSKNDFVHQWTTRYGDNHHDASTFFDNIDTIRDGVLTEFDLLFHLGTLDPTGSGSVTEQAFDAFVRANHPCGQHGHLGC